MNIIKNKFFISKNQNKILFEPIIVNHGDTKAYGYIFKKIAYISDCSFISNKELKKLYDGLLELADFLSIKNYEVPNDNCFDNFCWSWDSTSCYQLKLPVLKTCDINPISFTELKVSSLGSNMAYAPASTWEKATSKCCDKR
jgi:hypothetical protein